MSSNRPTLNRLFASAGVAALLVLSGCSESESVEGPIAGEPIAPITAPEGSAWTDVVTISDQGGHILGNPEAPLKLVEYASHTCGACAYFSTEGKAPLKENYVSTGIVSFEHRQLLRNTVDLTIALMVQCGAKESMQPLSDSAWQSFNDIMNSVQSSSPQIQATESLPLNERFVRIAEAAGLIDFFAARGLSADQARVCLADTAKIEALENASRQQAEEFNVTGTPTFFLNGNRVEGISWEDIEPVLQRAGAR